MNQEEKNKYREQFGRTICSDEIVIEMDWPCPDTGLAIIEILAALQQANYNVEEWRAEGMFSSHLHIKSIWGLANLSDPVRRRYKELFIKKYVPAHFFSCVDMALCAKHRIAEENKPHFKYRTKKIKVFHVGKLEINKVEEHLVRRAEIELQKEAFQKRHFRTDRNKPGESILEVAEKYGLEVNKYGKTLCPFHNDTEPSLSLNEEMGAFNCFGCNRHGNIMEFKKLLGEVNK